MKSIQRKDDWPEILNDKVSAARNKEFKYGSHDCCMFAADILRAMVGVDLAKSLRGYKTRQGAYRMLAKNGEGALLKTLDAIFKKHGCEKKQAAFLRRGDPVVAKVMCESGKMEYALGICIGQLAVFAGDGITAISMENVSRGWSVG